MNLSGFENTRDLAKNIENQTEGEKVSNPLGTENVNTPVDDDISMYNKGVDFMTYGNYYVQTEGIFDKLKKKDPKAGVYRPPITDDDLGIDGPYMVDKLGIDRSLNLKPDVEHIFGQGGKHDYRLEEVQPVVNDMMNWAKEQGIHVVNHQFKSAGNFLNYVKKKIPDKLTENFINFVREYKPLSFGGLKSALSNVEFTDIKSPTEHKEFDESEKKKAEYEKQKEAKEQKERDAKAATEEELKKKGMDTREGDDRRSEDSDRRN